MSDKPKNPSAFPYEELFQMNSHTLKPIRHSGMTLRDYFAGQALAGFVTPQVKTYKEWQQENANNDATYCYLLADAMLNAREVAQ